MSAWDTIKKSMLEQGIQEQFIGVVIGYKLNWSRWWEVVRWYVGSSQAAVEEWIRTETTQGWGIWYILTVDRSLSNPFYPAQGGEASRWAGSGDDFATGKPLEAYVLCAVAAGQGQGQTLIGQDRLATDCHQSVESVAVWLSRSTLSYRGRFDRVETQHVDYPNPPAGQPVWTIQVASRRAGVKSTEMTEDLLLPVKSHIRSTSSAGGDQLGKGVTVAVLDTGVNRTHFSLVRQKVVRASVVPGSPDGIDRNGHGTFCCGEIAGKDRSTEGILYSGISPGVRLISIQVLTHQGWGTDQMISDGLRMARSLGANIISLSIGGSSEMPLTRKEIAACYTAGITIIAAAGNDGPNGKPNYPALYEECISVAATGPVPSMGLAGFSSRGEYVDACAPGEDIPGPTGSEGYGRWDGTSMACPIVAGAAAILREQLMAKGWTDPVAIRIAVRRLLIAGCRALVGPASQTIGSGAGLIDVSASIRQIDQPIDEPPPPPVEPEPFVPVDVSLSTVTGIIDSLAVISRALQFVRDGKEVHVRLSKTEPSTQRLAPGPLPATSPSGKPPKM